MINIKTINITDYFDNRGFIKKFYETEFSVEFDSISQILISGTTNQDTVRGLHLQIGYKAEEKFIFPLTGRAIWFALDLRSGDNFKSLNLLDLDPEKKQGYFIPKGFAHGMISHTNNVNLLICASSAFDQSFGLNIMIEDPEIYHLIREHIPKSYIYDKNKPFKSFADLLVNKTLPIIL